jgi:hypothetical protein
MQRFDPELERRIQAFESTSSDDVGFTRWDWLALIALGVILPVSLLLWGWPW